MQPMKILVVDDEMTLSFFLRKALEEEGPVYKVETSLCASEALKKVRGDSFDLIIADFRMPGMSGLELVKEAKRHDISIKAILMTAFGTPQIEADARNIGVDYLTKPFSMEEMKRKVRRIARAKVNS